MSTLLAAAIISLAAGLHAAFGFGNALIAMPLLAIFLPLETASPLVALVAMCISGSILAREWRGVDLAGAWRLIVGSIFGIPIGVFFLREQFDTVMKLVLGVLVAGFSLHALYRPKLVQLRGEKWSFLFGFLAGVLGGAYNTNGPPVVVYGSMRGWPPATFRATLQGFFLLSGSVVLVWHWRGGLWTPAVLRLVIACLPGALLGAFFGSMFGRALSARRFSHYIYVLLLITGSVLLVQALAAFIGAV